MNELFIFYLFLKLSEKDANGAKSLKNSFLKVCLR